MKTRFFSIVLWLGIILLIAGLAGSSWVIFSYYKGEALSAVAQHKRIIIDLAAEETSGGETAADTGADKTESPSKEAEKTPEEAPKDQAAAAEPAKAVPTLPQEAGAGGSGGAAGESGKQEPMAAGNSGAAAPAPAQPIATLQGSGGQAGKEPSAEPKATEPKAAEAKTAEPKIRVAVIVTGLALSKSSTLEAMKLPAGVSFSFSPYSSNLSEWFQAAKSNGNEILMDLPMEPGDYPITDPGPYALLTSLSKDENLERLKSLISMADPSLSGLVASRDEKFSSSADNLAAVLAEIKAHKLRLYFPSRNSASPVFAFSNSFEVPVFLGDVILDDKITEEAINNKLSELEKTALAKGSAIAFARPYPLTVKLLAKWIPALEAKGIKLVPASELVSGEPKKGETKEGGE